MNASALSYFPLWWLSCLALVLFVLAFLGVFAQILQVRNKEYFERMSYLPLENENE